MTPREDISVEPDAKEPEETDQPHPNQRLLVTVSKPIPYTFDLGHLMCNDGNPLAPEPKTDELSAAARDCAQSLINQLLTTCDLRTDADGVAVVLPPPTTPLPREKEIPKAKDPTKWEKFAAKKGIKAKKREGNKVYDESTGEWVPRWGYKGANKKGESDWLVEVDKREESRTGEAGDVRKERRAEKKERIRRQERRERANAARTPKSTS